LENAFFLFVPGILAHQKASLKLRVRIFHCPTNSSTKANSRDNHIQFGQFLIDTKIKVQRTIVQIESLKHVFDYTTSYYFSNLTTIDFSGV
jgi:hypothetical protein